MSNAYGFASEPVNPNASKTVNATQRQKEFADKAELQQEIEMLKKDVADLKKAVDMMMKDVYKS